MKRSRKAVRCACVLALTVSAMSLFACSDAAQAPEAQTEAAQEESTSESNFSHAASGSADLSFQIAYSALRQAAPENTNPVSRSVPESQDVDEQQTQSAAVSAETDSAPAAVQDNPFDNLAVANITGALNLRAEPSTEAEILGTCYRGGGGQILERKDGWTKIRSGSLEGWLKDDYLVFGSDIQPIARELGLFTAKISTQTLNVREEPSTDSAIVALAAGDDYYPVLSEDDEWAKIQLSADTSGYVSLDYVSIRVKPGSAVSIADELAALEKAEKEAEEQKAKEKAAQKPAYVINASDDDIYLMAACIMMEADGSYEGQLAVGNVIVNRVKSGQWGNSIPDVIYAAGQFPGATSGLLDKYISRGPSSGALKAAKAALSGTNQIGNYLYFTSEKSASYGSYSDYVVVGGNCFYKK